MNDPHLRELEQKIDRLIKLCGELMAENRLLRDNEAGWLKERARLREKNEQARSRVEAMITRLKSLEQDS